LLLEQSLQSVDKTGKVTVALELLIHELGGQVISQLFSNKDFYETFV